MTVQVESTSSSVVEVESQIQTTVEVVTAGSFPGSDISELEQRLTDHEEASDGLINGIDFLTYYLLARDN